MTEYPAEPDRNRPPLHPGEVLDDVIQDTGKSKSEIAELLGISRQQLHAVLGGRKPLSPEIAARVGKLFGGGTDIWLSMQAAYDAWHAERKLAQVLKKIPTLTAA
jgi:addiction module HigA family antidote